MYIIFQDNNCPFTHRKKSLMLFCSDTLILNLLLFALGFWILLKGSERFIESAAIIARKWKVPELIIGLTLVSLGTALPEFSSSLYAAFHEQPDFIIGNVAGSITTNITLILGSAIAIGGTVVYARKLLTRDCLILNTVLWLTLAMLGFCRSDGVAALTLPCGLIFAGIAAAYYRHLFVHPEVIQEELEEKEEETNPNPLFQGAEYLWLTLGFAMIFSGSKLLVDNAVWAAEAWGVSPMVISATVVAFGTSVPELSVAVTAVLKKHPDMAIGNIIGSCIFNIVLIFGACAMVTPITVSQTQGWETLSFMAASGLLLFLMMWTGRKLARWEGIALIAVYLLFLCRNIWR